MTAQTLPKVRFAAFLFAVAFIGVLLVPTVPAELVPGTEGGSTRTIAWSLNDTVGLVSEGIAIENRSVVLEWVSKGVN
ncbi:MAG: hypothetical protein ACREDF_04165, partial [Thermoplasmata archaeon]